jgi:hypothetical protein
VVPFETKPLLSRDEARTLPKFQQEVFNAIDDRLLQITFQPSVPLGQIKELKDERVFDHVTGYGDLLALLGEREVLVLVTALCQSQNRGGLRVSRNGRTKENREETATTNEHGN